MKYSEENFSNVIRKKLRKEEDFFLTIDVLPLFYWRMVLKPNFPFLQQAKATKRLLVVIFRKGNKDEQEKKESEVV